MDLFERQLVPQQQPGLVLPTGAREVARALRESLGPGETLDIFDLPRVRVPTGGGLRWELPDGRQVDALTGVIILRQIVRAYWANPYTGGGQPPDCSSPDGERGYGNPGGLCGTCPFAQWGSDDSGGQACKLITRIFMLIPEFDFPVLLTLPPTSGRAARRYIVLITRHDQRYWHVVTEIRLQRTTNRDGLPYSQAVFKNLGPLTPEQRAWVNDYRQQILPLLQGMPVTAEEAQEEQRTFDVEL